MDFGIYVFNFVYLQLSKKGSQLFSQQHWKNINVKWMKKKETKSFM